MRVWYGIDGYRKDVTQKAFYHFCYDGSLRIPPGDALRDGVFGDYAPGYMKDVVIICEKTGSSMVYPNDAPVVVAVDDVHAPVMPTREERNRSVLSCPQGSDRLYDIHRQIVFAGVLNEEIPEQMLTATFLHADAKVLEIGANVGHNTMVIASILRDDSQFVAMETLPHIIPILEKNRTENGMGFHIFHGALSETPLYQSRDEWIVHPYDPVVKGPLAPNEFMVNTIRLPDLMDRYRIRFDTLVIDCEGAFYNILKEYPCILDGIRLIIIENDFFEMHHKVYVDEQFALNGFERAYVSGGGWGPCADFFYEVWLKK